MTLYAFNRRIEVRSTYHVRRRNRRIKPGIMSREAADLLIFWTAFGGFLSIAVALARLARAL